MAIRRRRAANNGLDAWPAYVDALSTLLMVTIFVLLVFVLAEAFLSTALNGSNHTIDALKAEVSALSDTLALETAKSVSLSDELAQLNATLANQTNANQQLTAQLAQETASAQTQSGQSLAQITLLNEQIAALRLQLAVLAQALDASEQTTAADQAQITDLGAKLNAALAQQVETLQQYRSEFFGTLRLALADQPNIRIVGDRFVLESDVLFPLNQATLTPQGLTSLKQVAALIDTLTAKIPPNINWVLSVDGYADPQKITSGPYTSNMDLSAARALAVLHALQDDGVPANRLIAAGYGDTHPITQGTTADDYAQDRRIEFRLTDAD